MRLIHTTKLSMKCFYGRKIPPYAILSHTWADEEVTLQDWNSPRRDRMKGFDKIRMTCRLAASDGIKYAWVDTCCIDKSNSVELSEAINSMYSWYQKAKVCYAYLSDLRLPASVPEDTMALTPFLRECRWFSRGWTLQELIAPAVVRFYEHDWRLVGNKEDWEDMLSEVTGISSSAMNHCDTANYSIAERMSWAAGRETTREEDMAYCLLGIFDVNMPMLYGEGAKAFRRLQEEIIRTGYDVSIFAWTKRYPDSEHWADQYLFAEAPGNFHSIPSRLVKRQWNEVSVTNAGVKLTLELCLVRMPRKGELSYVLPVCTSGWRYTGKGVVTGKYMSGLGVRLKKVGSGRFVRSSPKTLVEIPDEGETVVVRRIRCPDAYILIDPQSSQSVDLMHIGSLRPYFSFSEDCRVIKEWPPGSWDAVLQAFMTVDHEPNYGSLLVEVQVPGLVKDDEDGPARQLRTGEFVFLFTSTTGTDDTGVKRLQQDLQYTIVGYREHQLMLDTINLRMGAGDIDVGEMRRTLRNLEIPSQRTASVSLDGTGQYIHISVELLESNYVHRYFAFRSAPVVGENN